MLADSQDGVVGGAQLRAHGFAESTVRRWLDNGRLHRVEVDVYALGHRALSERAVHRAALLSCGERSALAHASALRHSDIVDLHDKHVHIVVPRGSCAPRSRFTVHRAVLLDERDARLFAGLRCTTVARSLIDLAGTGNVGALAYACRQAEFKRQLDVIAIGHTLARMNRPRGVRLLREVLAPAGIDGAIMETGLEQRGLTLLTGGDRPRPETQVWFDLRPDHPRVRVDLWYPAAQLVVEIDGPHHRLPLQRARDERRDAEVERRGIETLRITDLDLDFAPADALTRFDQTLTRRWSSDRAHRAI